MRERVELEVSAAAPGGTKVKVTAPVNPVERRHAVWIGKMPVTCLDSNSGKACVPYDLETILHGTLLSSHQPCAWNRLPNSVDCWNSKYRLPVALLVLRAQS